MQRLADSYALTPREADLCTQLASGASLDLIARRATVKRSTLRSHLASCFSKFGVSSQPELVARVLQDLMASSLIDPPTPPPATTPFLDPEIHGHPRFATHRLHDDRILGYFEYGDPDGIPAIYLHGSLDSGLFLKSQRLSGHGVRLIAVERGGVGESTPNPDSSPEAYARDVLALADYLGLEQFAVIGRSMGSWDAVSVALAAPRRVRLLVLVSGRLPALREDPGGEALPARRALLDAVRHSSLLGHLMLRMAHLQLRLRGVEQFVATVDVPELELEMNLEPTFQRHLYATWMRCATFGYDATVEHLKLYRRPAAAAPWEGLETPTLLVHGDRDRNVPVDVLVEQTASFRHRRVLLLPGAGHNLVHLAMGQVLDLLRRAWTETG